VFDCVKLFEMSTENGRSSLNVILGVKTYKLDRGDRGS
jgi:hypothetical protein